MGNFGDGKTCTSWKTSERKKDANEQAELSLHHFKAQLGHCGFLRKVCASIFRYARINIRKTFFWTDFNKSIFVRGC